MFGVPGHHTFPLPLLYYIKGGGGVSLFAEDQETKAFTFESELIELHHRRADFSGETTPRYPTVQSIWPCMFQYLVETSHTFF